MPAAFYLFGDSCDPKQINADCGSNGSTGILAGPWTASTMSLSAFFVPPATGIHHIAVESMPWPFVSGAFKLEIEELVLPSNGTCATAQQVTLGSGATVIKGDTTGVANEFGTAVNCGSYDVYYTGGQLYYQVDLSAGTTYTFTLTPGAGFDEAALYVFGDSCSWSQINADCGSKGAAGHVVQASTYQPGSISFTPAKSGKYRFAVDSPNMDKASGGYYCGPFEVTIK